MTRLAGDTRPFNLANTDNKLIALTCNIVLSDAASLVVVPMQRGFIKHRSMLDNIFECE